MTIQEAIQDPTFHGLPPEEQRKALSAIDADFGSLHPMEQNKVLSSLSGFKDQSQVPSDTTQLQPSHDPSGSLQALQAGQLPNTKMGPPPVQQSPPQNFDASAEADKVISEMGNFAKNTLTGMIPGANIYQEYKRGPEPGFEGPGIMNKIKRGLDYGEAGAADAMNLITMGQGAKGVLRSLPGAAPILQEEAIAAARAIPDAAIQGPPSLPLWNKVKAAGAPLINADKVVNAIDQSLTELNLPSNKNQPAIDFLTNIKDEINKGGGSYPINQLDADRRAIGKLDLGGLGEKIYKSIGDTLDQAISQEGPASQTASDLKAAINASKKEFAREDLATMIERKIRTRPGDNIQSINMAGIQDAMRKTAKGKEIIDRLGVGEVTQIEGMLKQINPPSLPPPSGVNFGSGKFLKTEGLLSGLGYLISAGDPKAAASAAAAGAAVQGTEYALSRLLVTKPGRDFLRVLSKANLSPGSAAIPALYQSMKQLIPQQPEAQP